MLFNVPPNEIDGLFDNFDLSCDGHLQLDELEALLHQLELDINAAEQKEKLELSTEATQRMACIRSRRAHRKLVRHNDRSWRHSSADWNVVPTPSATQTTAAGLGMSDFETEEPGAKTTVSQRGSGHETSAGHLHPRVPSGAQSSWSKRSTSDRSQQPVSSPSGFCSEPHKGERFTSGRRCSLSTGLQVPPKISSTVLHVPPSLVFNLTAETNKAYQLAAVEHIGKGRLWQFKTFRLFPALTWCLLRLDHICRVLFPLAYIACLIVFFGDVDVGGHFSRLHSSPCYAHM